MEHNPELQLAADALAILRALRESITEGNAWTLVPPLTWVEQLILERIATIEPEQIGKPLGIFRREQSNK